MKFWLKLEFKTSSRDVVTFELTKQKLYDDGVVKNDEDDVLQDVVVGADHPVDQRHLLR